MSSRQDSPIRVIVPGEKRPVAVVPSSVLQAFRLASEYAGKRPGLTLIIKRGEKVVGQIQPADTDAA